MNIVLGNADISACTYGISTGSSGDLSSVVRAMNNALNGCTQKVSATVDTKSARRCRRADSNAWHTTSLRTASVHCSRP